MKNILRYGSLVYVIIVLISHMNFENSFLSPDYDNFDKGIIIEQFAKEYNAISFPTKIITEASADNKLLLPCNFVLDTLISGAYEEDGNCYIRAEVKTKSNKRIFAKLRCNKRTKKNVEKYLYPHAIIAAKITNIIESTSAFYTDTLGGKECLISHSTDILLTGTCLDIEQINPSSEAI